MIKKLHEISVSKTETVGECPVFSTSCPFKTLMTNGKPLIDELEFRTWGVFNEEKEGSKSPTSESVKLAEELKQGTRKSHKEAENVHFVREFLKGRINKDVYKVMVAMLYYVYQQLEESMRNAAAKKDPIYTPLHFPQELDRTESLAQDLKYYYGEKWGKNIPKPTKGTEEYLARLKYIGEEEPSVLVAHAYTR